MSSGPPSQPVELHHPDGPGDNDQPEWSLADASERRACPDREQIAAHELQQHRMFGDQERLERPDHQSKSDDPEDRTHEGHVKSGGGSLPWHVSPETCGSLDVLCDRHRRYRNPP
jgi:hypothetical protein